MGWCYAHGHVRLQSLSRAYLRHHLRHLWGVNKLIIANLVNLMTPENSSTSCAICGWRYVRCSVQVQIIWGHNIPLCILRCHGDIMRLLQVKVPRIDDSWGACYLWKSKLGLSSGHERGMRGQVDVQTLSLRCVDLKVDTRVAATIASNSWCVLVVTRQAKRGRLVLLISIWHDWCLRFGSHLIVVAVAQDRAVDLMSASCRRRLKDICHEDYWLLHVTTWHHLIASYFVCTCYWLWVYHCYRLVFFINYHLWLWWSHLPHNIDWTLGNQSHSSFIGLVTNSMPRACFFHRNSLF